jgi:hypothetical protein
LQADAEADWESDWSDEEDPLPPAAEAMLAAMSDLDNRSCRTDIGSALPFKVSRWVEEAMMGLPSDIDEGKIDAVTLFCTNKCPV